MTTDFKDWAEQQLIDEAQTGLRGQGAIAELLSRSLKEQVVVRNLTRRVDRLTVWILCFTVALTLIAAFEFGDALHRLVTGR